MKICKSCNVEMTLDNFTPSKMTKDGREGKCRSCREAQRPKHSKVCANCEKSFESRSKSSRYCGSRCSGEARRKRISTKCAQCLLPIERALAYYGQQDNHFCGRECHSKYLSLTTQGENNPNYLREDTTCFHCGVTYKETPYKLKKHKYHFCTRECFDLGFKDTKLTGEDNPSYIRVDCTCNTCGVAFKRLPSQVRGDTYCSVPCRLESQSIRSGRKRELSRISVNCLNCGELVQKKPSVVAKNIYNYCSITCKNSHFSATFLSGEDNYNYNGSLSRAERVKERLLPYYNFWRISVYKRDKYTCQCCGDSKGGNLVAHHLYSYTSHPNLRVDVGNGITLCITCHADFHRSYGYGNNTKEQYLEHISNMSIMSQAD